jgi:hypothetical protein
MNNKSEVPFTQEDVDELDRYASALDPYGNLNAEERLAIGENVADFLGDLSNRLRAGLPTCDICHNAGGLHTITVGSAKLKGEVCKDSNACQGRVILSGNW